jgi:hypothetical protein
MRSRGHTAQHKTQADTPCSLSRRPAVLRCVERGLHGYLLSTLVSLLSSRSEPHEHTCTHHRHHIIDTSGRSVRAESTGTCSFSDDASVPRPSPNHACSGCLSSCCQKRAPRMPSPRQITSRPCPAHLPASKVEQQGMSTNKAGRNSSQ